MNFKKTILTLICCISMSIIAKDEFLEVFIKAARDGDLPLVQQLLDERKVSINDQSKKLDDQTALMAALFRKPNTLYTTEKVKEKKSVVEYLLRHGAKKELKNKRGQTALALANLAKSAIELSRLMIETDSDPINQQEKIFLDEQDKIYDDMIDMLQLKTFITTDDVIELGSRLSMLDTIAQA